LSTLRAGSNYSDYVPRELRELADPQSDIPRIAKDPGLLRLIEQAVQEIPTEHDLYRGDAREMEALAPESVHLVLTSPPYWTLKEYREAAGQMGHIEDYDQFLEELDRVWAQCFRALVPGGRLICVVGAGLGTRLSPHGHARPATVREHPGSWTQSFLARIRVSLAAAVARE